MDMTSSEVEYLTENLFQKQEAVTFHTLSRTLKIHHAQAKKALYEFYIAHKDKLSANFVVTGTNHGGSTSIKLCDENSVEEILKEDSKGIHGIHIYSLTQKGISISDIQLAVHERSFPVNYENLADLYKKGLIQGPKLTVQDHSVQAPVIKRENVSLKKEPTPSDLKKSDSKPVSTGLTSGYVSRKAGSAAAKKQPTADITSGYTSRKSEKTPPVRTTTTSPTPPPTKAAYQYKSRKAEKNQPKERVVVSSHQDEPEDLEDESSSKKTKANSEELQKLFEDDDSDFSDDTEDVIKNEPIVVEQTADPAEAENNIESERTTIPESFNESEAEPNFKDSSESTESKQTEEEEPEVESYVDEDGYLVTVNKKKKSPAPVAKSHPVKRTASPSTSASSTKDTKKKKTGQSSLMSFFNASKK
ncbi:hypothetical protein CLIB1423_03S03488 [[Candida] railenensis]|uniref:DNA polymerase delta subunit 3 n=1 Tax=[Candida] railenensis TaxID=45579 RepID=A0A9P0QMK0_9ASCO|nr:hypothetical protein CLIB1423_03S03488 [[Candida] railenensis]